MIRLAIDTSCAPSSLALSLPDSSAPITQILDHNKAGAENLICQIGGLMKNAALRFDQLDEIIVACGPGPFIGLRIGLAAARGLGLAARVPVKGASTLAAFAATAKAGKDHLIMAFQPSTSQRMIFQSFDWRLSALSPVRMAAIKEFEQRVLHLRDKKIHLVGLAAPQLEACSASHLVEVAALERPLAAVLLALPESCLGAPARPIYPPS